MRRSFTIALTVFAGPSLALLLLAIGCAQPWQIFGIMCGHNSYISLATLTCLVWLAFALGWVCIDLKRNLNTVSK